MKNENIFKQAVDHFGVENQLLKLVEEMAELTQLIIKRHLDRKDKTFTPNFFEELADVKILLNQIDESEIMQNAYNSQIYDYQLKRKMKRLESLLKTQNETKVEN